MKSHKIITWRNLFPIDFGFCSIHSLDVELLKCSWSWKVLSLGVASEEDSNPEID